jgi:hypothetical protein
MRKLGMNAKYGICNKEMDLTFAPSTVTYKIWFFSFQYFKCIFYCYSWVWWYKAISLASWEAEIGRIAV